MAKIYQRMVLPPLAGFSSADNSASALMVVLSDLAQDAALNVCAQLASQITIADVVGKLPKLQADFHAGFLSSQFGQRIAAINPLLCFPVISGYSTDLSNTGLLPSNADYPVQSRYPTTLRSGAFYPAIGTASENQVPAGGKTWLRVQVSAKGLKAGTARSVVAFGFQANARTGIVPTTSAPMYSGRNYSDYLGAFVGTVTDYAGNGDFKLADTTIVPGGMYDLNQFTIGAASEADIVPA